MSRVTSGDEARVRASTRQIGFFVGICSALVIALGITALVAVILRTARPHHEGSSPGGLPSGTWPPQPGMEPDHVVIDVDRVVPWIIVFGVVSVVALGFLAWFAARRTVRPLAQALRLQREFVADASHELRTPLTALVSRTQILERRLARGEPIDDVAAKLSRDARAMSDTLDELLAAASAEAGFPATCDPYLAIGDAVDRLAPLAEARGTKLLYDTPQRDTAVATARPEVDASQAAIVSLSAASLSRACIVLIDNALNYSPPGGTVTVRLTRVEEAVNIRVEDEGPGISTAEQHRIFERFARGAETGHRRGFGLGLSFARELAERAGGTVTIERTSPAGTVFLLRLPLGR